MCLYVLYIYEIYAEEKNTQNTRNAQMLMHNICLCIQAKYTHALVDQFRQFGDHLGVTLGSMLDRSWTIWGSLWDTFGVTLGSLWVHCGILLGSLWCRFGITLGFFGRESLICCV